MKMYSQCYIQKHGVEAWKEQYQAIRKRYFTGKITYGKGPLLEGEE
jgi:phage portal protein BeeE